MPEGPSILLMKDNLSQFVGKKVLEAAESSIPDKK